MKRFQGVVVITLAVGLMGGCVATRKYVRNEVKTSSDVLSGEIAKTNGEVKSTQESVAAVNTRVDSADQRITGVDNKLNGVDSRVNATDQKVAGIDNRLSDLDTRTTQSLNTLKADVDSANSKADATARDTAVLGERFNNRNTYEISLQQSVLFRFDSAEMPADGKSPLDEVAKFLQDNPEAIVVLEGHTDSTGDAGYNVKLGERRIEVVRRYLAVEKNVPVYRIEEISFGAARPLTSNDTRNGREQNRAVSVRVLVPLSATAAAGASN